MELDILHDQLILIDELLTGSSRFKDVEAYQPGCAEPNLDKQYVGDYLIQTGWNREPPGLNCLQMWWRTPGAVNWRPFAA